MKIYIAGDLRSEPIRKYINDLVSILESKGHVCYNPFRDVQIPGKEGPEKGLLSGNQYKKYGKYILKEDLRFIHKCEVFIFILDGLCWGTSVELGYVFSLKKNKIGKQNIQIIGIFTDPRGIDNLDVIRCNTCDTVLTSTKEILDLF